jgi:hypothetical protein
MTIKEWAKWYVSEQQGATREELEQAVAESLGYMSNTQTPSLFAREMEKFWEGDE